VRGLAIRKAETGCDVCMVRTSSTSNVAEQHISAKWIEKTPKQELDDATDDIHEYGEKTEGSFQYAQRTVDLAVVTMGLELGVKTLVIMSPTICGRGSGLFNTSGIQITAIIQAVMA
jgi:hypothetical protein